MFKIFRKNKIKKVDPIQQMLDKHTKDLEDIIKDTKNMREKVDRQIVESENALRELGYSQKDINKIKNKSIGHLQLIKTKS